MQLNLEKIQGIQCAVVDIANLPEMEIKPRGISPPGGLLV